MGQLEDSLGIKDCPKRINIGGFKWTIKFVHDKKWQADNRLKDDEGGCTWPGSLQLWIRYDEEINPDVVREVIMHEVLHAIYFHTGTSVGVEHVKRKQIEEYCVSAHSPVLFAALRDNPRLLAYLMG